MKLIYMTFIILKNFMSVMYMHVCMCFYVNAGRKRVPDLLLVDWYLVPSGLY